MSLFDELSNTPAKNGASNRQMKEAYAAQFKPQSVNTGGVVMFDKEEPNTTDTFFGGVEQAINRSANVFLPGKYKHKIYDTEGASATIGEFVGTLADPALLLPVVGAEVAAGKALAGAAKVASKFGILEKATQQLTTGIAARVFKNSIAGAVGGAVDAYEREQSNESADYLHSTLIGASLGVGFGEVLHQGVKFLKRTPLETFNKDTPNLKEVQAKAHAEDAIPLGDGQTMASAQDVATLIPEPDTVIVPKFEPDYSKVPHVIDNPIADDALIASEVEKTLAQTTEQLKRDPNFLPWKITKQTKDYQPRSKDLINADLEASNQLVSEVKSQIDDATTKMNNKDTFNSKTRNDIKINQLPELKKQLMDAEFMQAQYQAELDGKRAVMKSTYELDRDATRFDKMLNDERLRAQTEHKSRLQEYKQQQHEIAAKEKEAAEIKATNDHAQYLYNTLDDKSIEGLSNKLTSQRAAVANKLDLMWLKMENEVKLLSEHVEGSRYLLKALRKELIPDNELGRVAARLVEHWESIGYEGVKMMREVGINTGWLKGRLTRLTHNSDAVINSGFDKWFAEVNPRLKVAMSENEARIRYGEITNVRAELKSTLEQEQEIENLSRRFNFKTADDEFWYIQNFGYNYTPAQAMANNIAEVADKVAITQVLGKNPLPIINKFGELVGAEKGVTQGLADEIFPKVLGYKKTPAEAITFMNLAHAGGRLMKAIFNPGYQAAFGATDAQNAVLHVAQKTSVFDAISNMFRTVPDFTKSIAKLGEEERKTLAMMNAEFKNEMTVINASAYGLASPNGKLASITKYVRGLEFKINGSHQADTIVRNFTAKSYAYLMRDAYRNGRQVLEGVDNNLLKNAVTKDGFLNPYQLINSANVNERRIGMDLLAKYQEGIDAVNPAKSKAWGSVAKDSAGASAWVRQSGWMMKVMMRTNIPILQKLASNEVGGLAKVRMGSLLLGWAAIQTATEEAFEVVNCALEGKEYSWEKRQSNALKTFASLTAFGGMYWAYKLTSLPLEAAAKSSYYGVKGLTSDNEVDKIENYAKSEKALLSGSYIARAILGSWYEDKSSSDHSAYDLSQLDE